MPRLLHGLKQRNTAIGGFGEVPRAQSVRRELRRVETRLSRALLDDVVHGRRVNPAGRDIAQRSIPRNTLPLSIRAALSQCFNASTGRPVR